MTHKKKMFASLFAAVLLFSFFVSRITLRDLSNFGSCSEVAHKRLPVENVVLTNIERKLVLSLGIMSMVGGGTDFALYPDGIAVWKNNRSPTGYCSAIIPERIQKEILDLAEDSVSGARYDIVAATDQPMYTIQYGARETTIYGDPNNDPTSPWFINAWKQLWPPLPLSLLSLFNRLQTFDYEPATPWLPSEIHLELYPGLGEYGSPPTPLPEKLYSVLPLKLRPDSHAANGIKLLPKTGTIVTGTTNVELTIPVAQYKNEILRLISLPNDFSGRAVLVNGSAYRLIIVALHGKNLWYF
jgi:hypothetical protein